MWGAYKSIDYIYKELEYPISELKKYFRGEDNSESADKKANIDLFFIKKKIEELEGMAKEIDEEYDETGSEKMERVKMLEGE